MNSAALTAAGISPTGLFYVKECTDAGGLSTNLPAHQNNCEAATLLTSSHGSDGSMSMTGTNAFTVYDLPDRNLGAATMVGECDVAPEPVRARHLLGEPGGQPVGVLNAPPLLGGFQRRRRRRYGRRRQSRRRFGTDADDDLGHELDPGGQFPHGGG